MLDLILTQLASVLAFLEDRIQMLTDRNAPDLPKVLRKTIAKNFAGTPKKRYTEIVEIKSFMKFLFSRKICFNSVFQIDFSQIKKLLNFLIRGRGAIYLEAYKYLD